MEDETRWSKSELVLFLSVDDVGYIPPRTRDPPRFRAARTCHHQRTLRNLERGGFGKQRRGWKRRLGAWEPQNEHGSADDENENAQPEEESVERNLAIRRSVSATGDFRRHTIPLPRLLRPKIDTNQRLHKPALFRARTVLPLAVLPSDIRYGTLCRTMRLSRVRMSASSSRSPEKRSSSVLMRSKRARASRGVETTAWRRTAGR